MWRNLSPYQAAHVLKQAYQSVAGEEALFRALLAERDMDEDGAEFWVITYCNMICDRQEVRGKPLQKLCDETSAEK